MGISGRQRERTRGWGCVCRAWDSGWGTCRQVRPAGRGWPIGDFMRQLRGAGLGGGRRQLGVGRSSFRTPADGRHWAREGATVLPAPQGRRNWSGEWCEPMAVAPGNPRQARRLRGADHLPAGRSRSWGLSRHNDIAPVTDPAGQDASALRRPPEGRQRVTATLRRDEGRTPHVRKRPVPKRPQCRPRRPGDRSRVGRDPQDHCPNLPKRAGVAPFDGPGHHKPMKCKSIL